MPMYNLIEYSDNYSETSGNSWQYCNSNIFNATHPLTILEIKKYYQNEPKFNGVHSRNNLSKIQDGANVIHLDEYKSIGYALDNLYVNGNNIRYFDSFGIENIPKEIKKFIGKKKTNIYRIQAFDFIMCG